MTKFLIYIVAAAILVLLGVDTFFVATGKGTPETIVELAVGGSAILAFAVAAFVRTVGGLTWPSWHRGRKVTVDDVDDKVDTLDDKVDSRLGPEPDGFVAVINATGEDGKVVRLYDLPVSDTYGDAIQAARESLRARTGEGNPVPGARITVVPVYDA